MGAISSAFVLAAFSSAWLLPLRFKRKRNDLCNYGGLRKLFITRIWTSLPVHSRTTDLEGRMCKWSHPFFKLENNWGERGGLKKDPIRRGGVDFFWNNPFSWCWGKGHEIYPDFSWCANSWQFSGKENSWVRIIPLMGNF